MLMDNTRGALLVGTLIAIFASGMNALQTILYFRLYFEDSNKLKALVSVVFCLDVAYTGLICVDLWFFFISNFGNVDQITAIPKPYIVPGAVVVGTILVLIVHLFYLHRIFTLSRRNYWISLPILILILGDTASAIATTVVLYRYRTLSQLSAAWVLPLGFAFAAASDIAIMVALFILLRLCRQQSVRSESPTAIDNMAIDRNTDSLNNVIDKLILYSLEMGSLTAFIAIAIMIIWFTQQHTLIFTALYLPFPKVYATALLGSPMRLNTRYHLRRSQNYSQNSDGWNTVRLENLALRSEGISSIAPQIPETREESTVTRPHDIDVGVTRRVWNDGVPV